jgi:hypothetical protein
VAEILLPQSQASKIFSKALDADFRPNTTQSYNSLQQKDLQLLTELRVSTKSVASGVFWL